jgi:hypothetical protein
MPSIQSPRCTGSGRCMCLVTVTCLLWAGPTLGSTQVRITINAASSVAPSIARGADGLCRLAWADARDGNSEIYYALVDSFGNRLTADVRLTNSPGVSSTAPRVGVDRQGYAIVCWREANNVWVARLDRNGNIVSSGRAVNLGFSYVITLGPDLSVLPDGRFGVGFGAQHGGLDDMFVVDYDAGLNKLCQDTNVYTNLTFQGSGVSISCNGNLNCTLVWQRVGFLDGDGLARATVSGSCTTTALQDLCSGLSFVNPTNHGAGTVYQVSGHVVLSSGSGCGTQFSENPGPSINPASDSLDSGRSIVVWEDSRSGNADVYYARYDNAGFGKQGPDSNLTASTSASQAPAVTTDRAGGAFVSWQDNRDGNTEIYFARIPEPAGRGTLTGTVYDGVTLLPIPRASVALIYPQRPTIVSQNFVAGDDGRYRISGLPAGLYAMSASSAGHSSAQLSGLRVTSGSTIGVDLYVSTGTVLSGRVTDAASRLAIGSVQVRLAAVDGSFIRDTQSDPEGQYRFDLLPGTYNVIASLPAGGTATPYYSPANPFYVPDTVGSLAVGATPAALNLSLNSNTVVLLHGILSNDQSWGVVASPAPDEEVTRARLESAGFHTEAMRRDWKRGVPGQGAELGRWLSHQLFRSGPVLAHSMGGLAARWYVDKLWPAAGGFSVPLLITLGTPNHGSPVAKDVIALLEEFAAWAIAQADVPFAPQLTEAAFEVLLMEKWPFLPALVPGSRDLNLLNYGVESYPDDPSRLLCGVSAHYPEQLGSSARYVAVAGENPQSLRVAARADMFCDSDGLVPVHSARLSSTAPNVENYRTGCLLDPQGGAAIECNVSHFRPPGSHDRDFRRSECVARNVIRELAGSPMLTCGSVLEQPVAVDTVFQPLVPVDYVLAPAGSAADSFALPAGGYLGVRVRWARRGLRLSLRSPVGTVIDSAATVGVPGLLYRSDPVAPWARLDVANAQAGTWILQLTAVADTTQHVFVSPFVSGDVTLDVTPAPPHALPGQPVTLLATLERGGSPLLGGDVQSTVIDPSGNATVIALHDDGTAGDSVAGDGVYSGVFTATSVIGAYRASVRAAGGSGMAYVARGATAPFVVQPGLDLRLDPSDLSVSAPWGYPSDPIILTGVVRNNGDLAADSVWVSGSDDSTGVAFLDTMVAVPAHGTTTVYGAFASPRIGIHAARISASELAGVPESDYENNRATRLLEVVAFGGSPQYVGVAPAPASVAAPGIYLPTRVVPNPTRRVPTIQFYLAQPAIDVRLTVFDLQGRVIHQHDLGSRGAGWQTVAWESHLSGSQTSGVAFYLIEAGRSVGRGRIVMLR